MLINRFSLLKLIMKMNIKKSYFSHILIIIYIKKKSCFVTYMYMVQSFWIETLRVKRAKQDIYRQSLNSQPTLVRQYGQIKVISIKQYKLQPFNSLSCVYQRSQAFYSTLRFGLVSSLGAVSRVVLFLKSTPQFSSP